MHWHRSRVHTHIDRRRPDTTASLSLAECGSGGGGGLVAPSFAAPHSSLSFYSVPALSTEETVDPPQLLGSTLRLATSSWIPLWSWCSGWSCAPAPSLPCLAGHHWRQQCDWRQTLRPFSLSLKFCHRLQRLSLTSSDFTLAQTGDPRARRQQRQPKSLFARSFVRSFHFHFLFNRVVLSSSSLLSLNRFQAQEV